VLVAADSAERGRRRRSWSSDKRKDRHKGDEESRSGRGGRRG
jgi:hypothetical protein